MSSRCLPDILCGISSRFQLLSPSERQVAHALLTRSPLSHLGSLTEISELRASFDLHVLGTPPAFVLSQDQTLKYGILTVRLRTDKTYPSCQSQSLQKNCLSSFSAALKNPSLVLIRISFCLHCLIYKVHSQPRKALKSLAFSALSCLGLSVRCLITIALSEAVVKSFFQLFSRFFRRPLQAGRRSELAVPSGEAL